MKRSLFSVALACLAVAAAVPASAQINTSGIPNTDYGPFNLAEAYPCAFGGYTAAADAGITSEQLFHGTCASATIPSAAPGILSLQRKAGTLNLDINCFAVAPDGQFNCVVQAYRLLKLVPGSFKCPDVYGLPHFHLNSDGNYVLDPYTYVQFGGGVRTWWALNFTQPGTRFLLQVVSTCEVPQPLLRDAAGHLILDPTTHLPIPVPGTVQHTQLHVDSWRWRVVANEHTLLNVIELMHTGAISTLEVPCILGEDMYDALKKAVGTPPVGTTAGTGLIGAIHPPTGAALDLTQVGNAIFDMEALIVANCLFVEVLNPLVAFPGPDQFGAPNIQLPGNLAETVIFGTQGSAVAGIIDTVEHPCCCKLLVDLEWISIRNGLVAGIIGHDMILPTF